MGPVHLPEFMSAHGSMVLVIGVVAVVAGAVFALILDPARRLRPSLAVPAILLVGGVVYGTVMLPGHDLRFSTWWHGLLLRVGWTVGTGILTAIALLAGGESGSKAEIKPYGRAMAVVALSLAVCTTAILDLVEGPVSTRGAVTFSSIYKAVGGPRPAQHTVGVLTVVHDDGRKDDVLHVDGWRTHDAEKKMAACAFPENARVRFLANVGRLIDVACDEPKAE